MEYYVDVAREFLRTTVGFSTKSPIGDATDVPTLFIPVVFVMDRGERMIGQYTANLVLSLSVSLVFKSSSTR